VWRSRRAWKAGGSALCGERENKGERVVRDAPYHPPLPLHLALGWCAFVPCARVLVVCDTRQDARLEVTEEEVLGNWRAARVEEGGQRRGGGHGGVGGRTRAGRVCSTRTVCAELCVCVACARTHGTGEGLFSRRASSRRRKSKKRRSLFASLRCFSADSKPRARHHTHPNRTPHTLLTCPSTLPTGRAPSASWRTPWTQWRTRPTRPKTCRCR